MLIALLKIFVFYLPLKDPEILFYVPGFPYLLIPLFISINATKKKNKTKQNPPFID